REMRAIIHHALDPDHTGTGLRCKCRYYRARPRYLLRSRRERRINDRDLRRMDRHLAGEAVAPRLLTLAHEALVVAEVDIDRVDRLHARRRRSSETQAASETIRIEKVALDIAIDLG